MSGARTRRISYGDARAAIARNAGIVVGVEVDIEAKPDGSPE